MTALHPTSAALHRFLFPAAFTYTRVIDHTRSPRVGNDKLLLPLYFPSLLADKQSASSFLNARTSCRIYGSRVSTKRSQPEIYEL